MSEFNHSVPISQDSLATAEFRERPEFQYLIAAVRHVLRLRQDEDLRMDKPTRRAVRAEVARGLTGDGRSTFWARQNSRDPSWDPTFPASFKLGTSPRSATVWFADEIQAWLEARANACRKPAQAVSKRLTRKHRPTATDINAELSP